MTSPPPKPSHRRWWLIAFGLTCAWALFLTFFGPRGRPGALRLEPGTPIDRASYGWSLEGLDGKPVDFGRYRGRAVFLNVWATWCGPCLAELPSIARLAANPRLKDVAFVCASTDEDLGELRRFVAEKKLTLPVFRVDSLPLAFQTEGIPATFLIAPDGAIVASQVGSAKWDVPDVIELLERLSRTDAPPGH